MPGFSVHGDSPGKNIGVGCHVLLQGVFLTQGSNLCLMSPALAGGFFTTEPPRKPIFPQDDNNKLYTLDFFHVPKYESLAISILHC